MVLDGYDLNYIERPSTTFILDSNVTKPNSWSFTSIKTYIMYGAVSSVTTNTAMNMLKYFSKKIPFTQLVGLKMITSEYKAYPVFKLHNLKTNCDLC